MKRYIHIERSHAVTIQRHYRCAACWNPLNVGFDKEGDWIDCGTEECRTPGLVSSKWVERRLLEEEAEAVTMRKILQESFEWLKIEVKNKANRAQLLKEIGF